jgi:hypothetical protein
MAKNANLKAASINKKDEFYTGYDDIKRELIHYTKYFKGKTIYCNCDDHNGIGLGTPKSNFIKYLADNFQAFGIKKVIATHYEKGKKSTKYILDKDNTGDGTICMEDVMEELLNGDGDFRSDECIELLRQSDIVITNPPFSLFREYVTQLIGNEKKFIIMGDQNAITYKEIFILIKENKLWLGNDNGGTKWFQVPSHYNIKTQSRIKEENGNKYFSKGSIMWYTNLDHKKRHEILDTGKKYIGFEKMYTKYDNYNAINVDRYSDIPMDYKAVMGVPITFLDKFNPDQFEVIGLANDKRDENEIFIKGEKTYLDEQHKNFVGMVLNGRATYARILIKKKRKK